MLLDDEVIDKAEVVPTVARSPTGGLASNPPVQAQAQQAQTSGGPNTNPLNLFPQGIPDMGANENAGDLDFLRNSQQVFDGSGEVDDGAKG
ncbi:hypothetical protein Ahy_A04g017095 [Arachis hypogaea]|uniref:Uncharacterized protein n=1 Tax=Arachis hypogaea TaxID=3818 RepID=A0A445D9X6_ARAHY|nr:hypothetical protein Ahy_A04g017095 [Arachis hypogaea]